jgi:gamma-glutamyl phosphate reductase
MEAPFNKENLNDIRLLNHIRKTLPGVLNRMNMLYIEPSAMDQVVEHFAEYIKSQGVCLESFEKLKFNVDLTPEDQQEFESYLDQILRQKFMLTKGKRVDKHIFKTFVGKLWSKVVSERSEDKQSYASDKDNAVIGVRG